MNTKYTQDSKQDQRKTAMREQRPQKLQNWDKWETLHAPDKQEHERFELRLTR